MKYRYESKRFLMLAIAAFICSAGMAQKGDVLQATNMGFTSNHTLCPRELKLSAQFSL